jgi:hypothetical protein
MHRYTCVYIYVICTDLEEMLTTFIFVLFAYLFPTQ